MHWINALVLTLVVALMTVASTAEAQGRNFES